jgi:TPR repeat protein
MLLGTNGIAMDHARGLAHLTLAALEGCDNNPDVICDYGEALWLGLYGLAANVANTKAAAVQFQRLHSLGHVGKASEYLAALCMEAGDAEGTLKYLSLASRTTGAASSSSILVEHTLAWVYATGRFGQSIDLARARRHYLLSCDAQETQEIARIRGRERGVDLVQDEAQDIALLQRYPIGVDMGPLLHLYLRCLPPQQCAFAHLPLELRTIVVSYEPLDAHVITAISLRAMAVKMRSAAAAEEKTKKREQQPSDIMIASFALLHRAAMCGDSQAQLMMWRWSQQTFSHESHEWPDDAPDGLGMDAKKKAGRTWLELSAQQDDPMALVYLALEHRKDAAAAAAVARDGTVATMMTEQQQLAMLRRAAESTNLGAVRSACESLAVRDIMDDDHDHLELLRWARRGATLGSRSCKRILALMYIFSDSDKVRDFVAGWECLAQAAEAGDTDARSLFVLMRGCDRTLGPLCSIEERNLFYTILKRLRFGTFHLELPISCRRRFIVYWQQHVLTY